jgi:hypothetical protein
MGVERRNFGLDIKAGFWRRVWGAGGEERVGREEESKFPSSSFSL